MSRSPGDAVPLLFASQTAALGLGIAMGTLLTTQAGPFNPTTGARWFVYPLVVVPVPLMAVLARDRWIKRLLAGWNLTALLALCSFFRAGMTLVIPSAVAMWQLAAISLLTGLGAGAAAMLQGGMGGRRRWWLHAGETFLASVGLYLGAFVWGYAHGAVSYYASSGLMVLSAILVSFAGRVDG